MSAERGVGVASRTGKPTRGRPRKDETLLLNEQRERVARRRREIQVQGADIGEIPPVVDPARRSECEFDFLAYLETYEAAKFPLAFSPSHKSLIKTIEDVVLDSGLHANAYPRGSGKTTIARAATRWAIAYGHRKFVVFLGAEEGHANASKDSILAEFETNDLLLDDFPEICIPFKALEGQPARCRSQRYQGERTLIAIDNTHNEIHFPWIEGIPSKGAILRWSGLLGRIRGDVRTLPDGTEMRPDLVIIDDPQTEASAKSLTQNRDRLATVRGAVLGLAGPGKQIAAIMPCTVIKPGDMADQVLDMETAPEWNGSRVGFFVKQPKNLDRWDDYMNLVRSRLREVKLHGGSATEAYESGRAFVEEHYDELHEGAEVYWPERHEPHELSAVHHAFNVILRIGWDAWHSEYQNAPIDPTAIERQIQLADFEDKPAGYKRLREVGATVPDWVSVVTSFVDVQGECLFWMTCGFSEEFRGALLDYGVWPDQGTSFIDLDNLRKPMSAALGLEGAAEDARILAALKTVLPGFSDAEITRQDGVKLPCSQVFVDRGAWTTPVDRVLNELRLSNVLGMKGLGVTAGEKPFVERAKAEGHRRGENWFITRSSKDERIRYMQPDLNYWKSFVRNRILTPAGSNGEFRTPGNNPRAHDGLYDHLMCEFSSRVTKKGQTKDEWQKRPGRERNDWWDCLIGCYVAASMHGCKFTERAAKVGPKSAPTRALSLSEIQRMRKR